MFTSMHAADLMSPTDRITGAIAEATAGRQASRSGGGAAHAKALRGLDRRGTGHGMLNAGHVRSRWGVAWRHVLMVLINKLPGTRFKSRLVARLLGVRMGDNVGIACNVFLDPYDPSMIRFGDNVIVGYSARMFVHMFTLDRQRVKPITIGDNVIIGAFSIIAPGVTIGDGASVAPGTVVSRNVPAGAIAMGNPMQIKKRSGTAQRAAAALEA